MTDFSKKKLNSYKHTSEVSLLFSLKSISFYSIWNIYPSSNITIRATGRVPTSFQVKTEHFLSFCSSEDYLDVLIYEWSVRRGGHWRRVVAMVYYAMCSVVICRQVNSEILPKFVCECCAEYSQIYGHHLGLKRALSIRTINRAFDTS